MRAEGPCQIPAGMPTNQPTSIFPNAMKRAVGALENLLVTIPGVLPPGWYEPGLWPIIYAMPQSLSLVVIHVVFSTSGGAPFPVCRRGTEMF